MHKWGAVTDARAQLAYAEELASVEEHRIRNRGQPVLDPMTLQEVSSCCSVRTELCPRSPWARRRTDDAVCTEQAVDYLYDPELENNKRYGQFPVVSQNYKWAEREGEHEDEAITFLEAHGERKVELWVFPKGFNSPLMLDSPLFMEKTMFLLDGEVRTCSSVQTEPCRRMLQHDCCAHGSVRTY